MGRRRPAPVIVQSDPEPVSSFGGCSYIIGDPKHRDFCDRPRKPGSSYCPEHHKLTHTKT